MGGNNNIIRLLRFIRAPKTTSTFTLPHSSSSTRYQYEPLMTRFQSSSLLSRRGYTPLTRRYFHTSNAYTSGKSEPFKRLITGLKSSSSSSSSSSLVSRGYIRQLNANWKLQLERYRNVLKSCNLGYEFSMWRILGVSAVLGSFLLPPRFALCMDDAGSVDDHGSVLCGSEIVEEYLHKLMVFSKRLLMPIALLLIVLTNWNFPVALAVKVIFTFVSTKPNPFSVYLFIEQLQQLYGRQHPFLHKFKSSYAKTVEVEDYKVFNIAKVNIEDHTYTLLGILGGWWAFELPSFPLSDLRDIESTTSMLISELWSRFLEIGDV